MTSDAVDRLRNALHHKNLVPFVGAGVSAGAADLPNWPALIRHGLEHLRNGGHPDGALEGIRSLIDAGDLMSAASALQTALCGAVHEHWTSNDYAAWLQTAFGSPDVTDTSVLLRLRQLNSRVVVTTNYDRILESHVKPDGRSLTWQRPGALRSMLRADEGIAHLHGRYDLPASVIFSHGDYQRIIDDKAAERVAQTLFETGILMFVGVSPRGADDPHLAKLLDQFVQLSDVASEHEPYPHVFLCSAADDVNAADITRLRARGVEVLEYGPTRADLEAFLQGLSSRERLVVGLDEVSRVLRRIGRADSVESAVLNAVQEIESWIYPGRDIHVSYAEGSWVRQGDSAPCEVPERYALSDPPCVFHYPISVAGWAMAEARQIAWPLEQHRTCSVKRVRKLGRMADVEASIAHEGARDESAVRAYVDLDAVARKFADDQLTIGDLFQDWSNLDEGTTFSQFLSVPVPQLDASTSHGVERARGVFNIDSRDTVPLSDPISDEKLRLITDLVHSVYLREERAQ